jgi:hypothetical protein
VTTLREFSGSESNLRNINITDDLQRTLADSEGHSVNFLLADTGEEDETRVMIFGTQDNLNWMRKHREFYIDGTFNIAPKVYKQVFTFQLVVNGFNLPMLYCFLPDKTSDTYRKCFNLVSELLDFNRWPIEDQINWRCDFEKGIWKGIVESEFATDGVDTIIEACYFHLASNLLKHVGELGLAKTYKKSAQFRAEFRYIKCLAFTPVSSVVSVFEMLYNNCKPDIEELYRYFEEYYIGKKRPGSQRRSSPLFPPNRWNVCTRVIERRGRADCEVEAWHGVFGFGIGAHPTMQPLVKHLQLEQNKVERRKIRILGGEVNSKNELRVKNDKIIRDLVLKYDSYKDKMEYIALMEIQIQQYDKELVVTNNAIKTINGVAREFVI